MRNGYYIIDAHCHIYPDKIAARAAEAISVFYDGLGFCGGSVSDLLMLMDQQGIDLSLVNSAAMSPKQVDIINNFTMDAALAHPGRMVHLGTLHPDTPRREQAAQIRFLKDNGHVGIKIHPDMLSMNIDDPRLLWIFAQCEEAKIPVLLHTGDCRLDYSNLNRFEPVAQMFPELTLIGGHFAGRDFYQEAADRLHGYENVFCDCSSAFDYMEDEESLSCLRTFTSKKVMFGTDHPMFSPGRDLDCLFRLPLTEEELADITHRTAERVFNLPTHD